MAYYPELPMTHDFLTEDENSSLLELVLVLHLSHE
jgi:hypothetical protein